MTDTIQKIADEMYARASKLAGEAGDGDHLLQVIGREVAETVNGWADRLRALSPRVTPEMITEQRRALDELEQINARLSARASAGEGGVAEIMRGCLTAIEGGHDPRYGFPTGPSIEGIEEAAKRIAALTAAPQPAQAGASGGGELIGHLYRVAHTDKAAARPWESSGTVFVAGPAPVDGRRGAIQHLNVYAYASPATGMTDCRVPHSKYDPCHNCEPDDTPPAHGDGEVWDGEVIRAAFERWAGPQGLRLNRRDFKGSERLGQYCDDDTQLAFEAWREAARPTPEAQEARDCTCPSGDGSLRWPCPKHPPVDANVAAVQRKLGKRSVVGLRKYGVSTERGDLSHADWLRHLQEELMDAAVYVEAAMALPAQGEGKV